MTLNAVVLPAPFGPIRPKIVPSSRLERDVVERDDAAEPQRGVLEREEGHSGGAETLRVSPRESRYSCQSCSIVVSRGARDVRRVVRRVVDGADDERALGVDVEDVDAARRLLEPPRKMRSPVSARPRIARLTAPCRTSRATSQPRRRAARRARGSTRSKSSPIVLAAEEARVERDDAAERGRHHLLHRPGSRPRSSPLSISRSVGFCLRLASGATMRAVSSVRGRPLVTTRSNTHAVQRIRGGRPPAACPSSVSSTSCG